MTTNSPKKCHHVRVPSDTCMLVFSDERMAYAKPLGFSAGGEEMWAHCCQVDDGIRPTLAGTGRDHG
jgi:hypothetical protein